MKILSKNVYLSDFYPPIISKIIRFIFNKQDFNIFNKQDFHSINNKNRQLFMHDVFKSCSGHAHEDLLLDYLIRFKEKGFYVEVGANDPDAFNSHLTRFYLRGWSGINIEPQKDVLKKLESSRIRDINLNLCLGDKEEVRTFYRINGVADGASLNKEMALFSSRAHGVPT